MTGSDVGSSTPPPQRVGLFGGAFDPPHCTHIALAQAALEQLHLTHLHVVPTGTPAHRPNTLSAPEHRLHMARLSFAHLPQVVVDDCEVRRASVSYTFDTLTRLRTCYPQAQLMLMIGADQAASLASWYRFQDILSMTTLVVAQRGSVPVDVPFLQRTDVHWVALHMPLSTLSATEVRTRVLHGQSIKDLVVEPVARYIEQHHLYQTAR